MSGFNAKIGAVAAVGAAALYATLALATGHTARADPPPDLSATGAGLDVWKTLALLVDQGDAVAILDVRPKDNFQLHHLPGARSLPAASASELRAAAGESGHVLIVADQDTAASMRVAELRQGEDAERFHFLEGGVQSWYLSVQLPVPLFSDEPAPFGYRESMALVQRWLDGPEQVGREELRAAVGRLATLGYQPTQLGSKKRPKASGKRKKIAGGCG